MVVLYDDNLKEWSVHGVLHNDIKSGEPCLFVCAQDTPLLLFQCHHHISKAHVRTKHQWKTKVVRVNVRNKLRLWTFLALTTHPKCPKFTTRNLTEPFSYLLQNDGGSYFVLPHGLHKQFPTRPLHKCGRCEEALYSGTFHANITVLHDKVLFCCLLIRTTFRSVFRVWMQLCVWHFSYIKGLKWCWFHVAEKVKCSSVVQLWGL